MSYKEYWDKLLSNDGIVTITKDNNIPKFDYTCYDKEVKEYRFTDCTFSDEFMFDSSEEVNTKFTFRKCTFKEQVEFNVENGKLNNILAFDSTVHEKWIKFNGTFLARIFIRNITFTDYANIEFSSPIDKKTLYEDIIILNSKSHLEEISFTGIKINKLLIQNISNIDKIILFDTDILSKLTLTDMEILHDLKLYNVDFLENSKILFENLNINSFNIEKISQDAKFIQFHHIDILENFISDRVEFKNTYFNDFNIAKASKKIEKTSFIDSHLNSVKWGKIFQIQASQDIFRQLKFVNDNQGNHIEANLFYTMEMEKYKSDILDNKTWFSNWWQEKLIFLFGKKLSNFGQSWFLPFLWILLSNLLLYVYIYLAKDASINIPISFSILITSWIFVGRLPYELSLGKEINLYAMQHISIILGLSLIIYLFKFGSLNDLAIFMNIKMPSNDSVYANFLHIWMLNKLITGFIVYHFIIALRRQTRR